MDNKTQKQKVLIVDDMPICIQVLAEAFKDFHHVKIATTGEKALAIAFSDNPPDLILLDVMMPEMDGYEVCRRLKRDHKTKDIPVIFITAKDEVEDETMGLQLGAVDYVTKPFHLPIVKARAKTHLDLRCKTQILEETIALDGLTNIPNRRRFDEVLEKEWKRAMRTSHHLSLIMMDIDFFKRFNDTYGHAAGDDCLKKVAQMVNRSLRRAGDFAARYGGEEFVAILPIADAQEAAVVSEKLRHNIESLKIPHAQSLISDHVTLCLGGATMIPTRNSSPSVLVEAADKMLYQAKQNGRNQVRLTTLEEKQNSQ